MQTLQMSADSIRPLGATERLFYKMNDYGGMNAFVIAKISFSSPTQAIDEKRLEQALKTVIAKSELFFATFSSPSDSSPRRSKGVFFRKVKDFFLPYKKVTVDNIGDEIPFVEADIKDDFAGGGCLWRLILVEFTSSPGQYKLIAIFDHAVVDGTGMCHFIKRILSAYELLGRNTGGEPNSITECSQSEQPVDYYSKYRFGLVDLWNFIPLELTNLIFPSAMPNFKCPVDMPLRTTKFVSGIFDSSTTEKIRIRCKEKNTTVHGLIAAANMMAYSKLILSSRKTIKNNGRIKLITGHNVDLRKKYGIGLDAMGVFASSIAVEDKLDRTSEFWSLARQSRQKITSKIAKRLHLSSSLIYEWLQHVLSDDFRIKLLNGKQQGRLGSLNVSNLGVLDIPAEYGDLKLTELGFGASQHGFGSCINMSTLTFDGRLGYNLIYVEPLVSMEMILEMQREFERIVTLSLERDFISLESIVDGNQQDRNEQSEKLSMQIAE